MSKVVKTQLVWKYKPKNYFEQPITIDFREWDIKIEDGEAVALIDPQVLKNDEKVKQDMSRRILNQFQAVQLFTHRVFELGDCVRTDIKEDGKKVTYGGFHATVQVIGKVDYIVHNQEGKVTFDSKKERSRDQEKLTSLIDIYRNKDQVLDHVLDFFQEAMSDTDDELVHLFNIRDSLKKRFGSKKDLLKSLDIDEDDYNRFGDLTNNLPLNQGRHKGLSVGELRDATQSELSEARRIAEKFIRSYLDYLDKKEP